jgi:hypothetical protein
MRRALALCVCLGLAALARAEEPAKPMPPFFDPAAPAPTVDPTLPAKEPTPTPTSPDKKEKKKPEEPPRKKDKK